MAAAIPVPPPATRSPGLGPHTLQSYLTIKETFMLKNYDEHFGLRALKNHQEPLPDDPKSFAFET